MPSTQPKAAALSRSNPLSASRSCTRAATRLRLRNSQPERPPCAPPRAIWAVSDQGRWTCPSCSTASEQVNAAALVRAPAPRGLSLFAGPTQVVPGGLGGGLRITLAQLHLGKFGSRGRFTSRKPMRRSVVSRSRYHRRAVSASPSARFRSPSANIAQSLASVMSWRSASANALFAAARHSSCAPSVRAARPAASDTARSVVWPVSSARAMLSSNPTSAESHRLSGRVVAGGVTEQVGAGHRAPCGPAAPARRVAGDLVRRGVPRG